MKATSESSSNLGSPISMRDVLIRVWDQGYQSPHFRRSRFRPDGITFRITIACRQFPYSAAFTTNINWKKSRLEKFRMSYLRSTMAAAASFGRAGRMGLPVGAPDHTARTRQRLEMVDCPQAQDGWTGMGDVSNHAAHPCQVSRQAGTQ